jgi:hypothetical protein
MPSSSDETGRAKAAFFLHDMLSKRKEYRSNLPGQTDKLSRQGLRQQMNALTADESEASACFAKVETWLREQGAKHVEAEG